MIQESYEWKQAIKRNNSYIRRNGRAAIACDESYLLDRIQIRIVSNALFVRRLLETPKVATALRDREMQVISHPWSGEGVDDVNCHRIDRKYQLNNAVLKSTSARMLCDQIIHSFVWTWLTDECESKLYGFAVSSDRKRESELFVIDMERFIAYAQEVANSNPSEMRGIRNADTGQWEFVSR